MDVYSRRKQTHRQRKPTWDYQRGEESGEGHMRGMHGSWTQTTTVCKEDKQQVFTAERGELYPSSCNNL